MTDRICEHCGEEIKGNHMCHNVVFSAPSPEPPSQPDGETEAEHIRNLVSLASSGLIDVRRVPHRVWRYLNEAYTLLDQMHERATSRPPPSQPGEPTPEQVEAGVAAWMEHTRGYAGEDVKLEPYRVEWMRNIVRGILSAMLRATSRPPPSQPGDESDCCGGKLICGECGKVVRATSRPPFAAPCSLDHTPNAETIAAIEAVERGEVEPIDLPLAAPTQEARKRVASWAHPQTAEAEAEFQAAIDVLIAAVRSEEPEAPELRGSGFSTWREAYEDAHQDCMECCETLHRLAQQMGMNATDRPALAARPHGETENG